MNPPADHPSRVSAGAVPSARDDYAGLVHWMRGTRFADEDNAKIDAGRALDELDVLRAAVLLATDMARHTADLLEQKVKADGWTVKYDPATGAWNPIT